MRIMQLLIICWSVLSTPRNERGLSQSTENAVLLAGAVTIAGIVIAAVTIYVKNNLPA